MGKMAQNPLIADDPFRLKINLSCGGSIYLSGWKTGQVDARDDIYGDDTTRKGRLHLYAVRGPGESV